MKVLVTTTSFQDTPGKHHTLLKEQNYELDFARGPIKESELLRVIEQYDAVLCGDDEYTREVLLKGKSGRLKYISKYGVGLDKVDLVAAKELGIPVTNCPGVNQISVAEHVLALLFSFEKNIHLQYQSTQEGSWKRLTGNEIFGNTIGIIGLGAIGKELAKRSSALGLNVMTHDIVKDESFLNDHNEVLFVDDINQIYSEADIISLHIPHTTTTERIINTQVIEEKLEKNPIIINASRGMLIDTEAMIAGLKKGKVRGYLTDVLVTEPMTHDEKLKGLDNVIITPHIGSRTYQSVERQGLMAVKNLIKLTEG